MYRLNKHKLFPSRSHTQISIHHMYRLNLGVNKKPIFAYLFQYITCIGWINQLELIDTKVQRFQYITCIGWTMTYFNISLYSGNFNTSHVSVEQSKRSQMQLLEKNFNTSHVSVEHREWVVVSKVKSEFQYITCIGWTNHLKPVSCFFKQFQYITCIGWTCCRYRECFRLHISIHHMYRLNRRTGSLRKERR